MQSLMMLIISFTLFLPPSYACKKKAQEGGEAQSASSPNSSGGGSNPRSAGEKSKDEDGSGRGMAQGSASATERCIAANCPTDASVCQAQCVRDPSGPSWLDVSPMSGGNQLSM